MANFAASTPPLIEYVSVAAGKSASLACTINTVPVPFSAKLAGLSGLNTGLNSLTGVTVTAIACVVELVPSLAVTCTSYTLFAPTSVGDSKFGDAIKLNTPVLPLMAR